MNHKHDPKYHKFIKKLIVSEKMEALGGLLNNLDAVEIANALIQLKLKHQTQVLEVLDNEKASEVVSYLHNSPLLQNITEHLKTQHLTEIIEEMDKDDAADFVSILEDEKADEVLSNLSKKDQDEITTLLQYNEESAGGIMNPHVVTATKDMTVAQAVVAIRKYTTDNDVDQFYTIYVIDDHRHLIGTVEVTSLLLASPKDIIENIMDPDVVAVDVDLDQEEVAKTAREYDLVVVPVIDRHLRLIGRITIDDLVDVISEEYEEDIGMISGTGDEDVLDTSLVKTVRDRLPWLLLAMLGGGLAALVMNFYEESIKILPKVAYFVPLIAAMGGNIGIQSSSIVVRGLATGEIRATDLVGRLWRELRVGFLNGVICSVCLLFLSWYMSDSLNFGVSSGVSLLIVVVMAAGIGASVPIVLKRLNIDPALATGPFITTANDVLDVSIYLVIAFKINAMGVF